MTRIWFITGTDTNVGKTFLTVLLSRLLEERSEPFCALKPFCSGGRTDARHLFRAQQGRVPLELINPWSYRQPVAPWLAARAAQRQVKLPEVVRYIRAFAPNSGRILVEGAGGLLSPLGAGFCARELIVALNAIPLVVCPNRLGAINQSRLVFSALPPATAARAHLVLMDPLRPDVSTRSNSKALAAFLDAPRIHRFPWFPAGIWGALDPSTLSLLDQLIS